MDVRDLRRRNALALLKREKCSKSELARRLDKSPQHVGQYLRESSQRNIGHAFAREIEKSFGLETGWLDRNHDHSEPMDTPTTGNPVEAIQKANRVSQAYIDARRQWLNARPQAVYLVRSELRKRLMACGIDILSETDDEFSVMRSGLPVRIDLFIPLVGFDVYRYRGTASMELPDYLALSTCESSSVIGFYLVPKEALEAMPDNTELRLQDSGHSINGVDISRHLNNFNILL